MSHKCSQHFWNRRDFLFRSGGGISGLALAYLMERQGLLAAGEPSSLADACSAPAVGVNPYAPKHPHFAPRAKAVISLFMCGGPSQVDTWDPKPALSKYAGEPIDGKVAGDVIVRQGFPGPLMPSPFTFKKHGQSGIEVAEIFPHISQHVDELAVIQIGIWPIERPRPGHLRNAVGPDQHWVPEHRLVGNLRPGIGGFQPAGVRRAH